MKKIAIAVSAPVDGLRIHQLAGTAAGTYRFDAKPRDIQSAVVRLSYKFGAPVVARY